MSFSGMNRSAGRGRSRFCESPIASTRFFEDQSRVGSPAFGTEGDAMRNFINESRIMQNEFLLNSSVVLRNFNVDLQSVVRNSS